MHMTLDECETVLAEAFGVGDETLTVVECINGRNYQTLCDVLFAVAGLRGFEDIEEEH